MSTEPAGTRDGSTPADRNSRASADGRPSGVVGSVVGEHAGEEQREIAETAQHAGQLGDRHGVEQISQLHGVELAEASPSPPTTSRRPGGPTHDVGVGAQQLDEEEAPQRIGEQLAQRLDCEHGHALAWTDPLLDVRRHAPGARCEVHGDGEGQERRHGTALVEGLATPEHDLLRVG